MKTIKFEASYSPDGQEVYSAAVTVPSGDTFEVSALSKIIIQLMDDFEGDNEEINLEELLSRPEFTKNGDRVEGS